MKRAAAGLGALLVIVLLGGGIRMAGASTAGDGGTWVERESDGALFRMENLVPGDRGSVELDVSNPLAVPAVIQLGITDLRTDDNGCVQPERRAGDTSCGRGGGELQRDLYLSVTEVEASGSASDDGGRHVGAGSIEALVRTPVEDGDELGRGGRRRYRVAYDFPIESSNVTQSDDIGFAVEITAAPSDPGARSIPSRSVHLPGAEPLRAEGARPTTAVLALAAVAALLLASLRSAARRRS